MGLLYSLYNKFIKFTFIFLLTNSIIYSQTTGKISGTVNDATTGEPLFGANVVVEGTTWGAATDFNGDFFIINIPPGTYNLIFQMLGYEKLTVQGVLVSVNRTTTLELELSEASIALGQDVVVVADKVSLKKDQTGSIRNVNKDQIEALPVENLTDVVNLQTGVVQGHFRGGRLDEVSYLVDGLVVDDSFGKVSRNVDVETNVIEEVEVITGTFNAEYGNAMSGVVNAVTKDGGNEFRGSVSVAYSNYLTTHKDIFIGLEDDEFDRNKDYRVFLSGPIIKDLLSFVVNARFQDNKDHLNGVRRYNVDDFSSFESFNQSEWYSEHTGDSAFVPLSDEESYSIFGKLTLKPFAGMRTSFTFNRNKDDWRTYNHRYKYNPDGRAYWNTNSNLFAFQLNHSLSNSIFYEFKASLVDNFRGYYVFEDPLDSKYVHDIYSREDVGFFTGGQEKDHIERNTTDINAKFDFTWQINKNHIIKTGFSYTGREIDNQNVDIRNAFLGSGEENFFFFDTTTMKLRFPNYSPEVLPDSTVFSDIYEVSPIEMAFYVQDKMEYDNMVVNFGLRMDYFDPNTVYPSDWRNPSNSIRFSDENSDRISTYPDAETHIQLSPRLGLSYQLGEAALLRFAYGHFFQMPPLYALYTNHSFVNSPSDFETLMGNPNLKPQRTVQYEVGLWQQLMEGMGFEVAVFYRDIYDLLGTRIISTYNQVEYGLYTNVDYGNAKGLELKFDYRLGNFSLYTNYTLQFTKGNAEDPTFSFDRAGENIDPVNKLVRMPWDQRHTLNTSVGYNTKDYGATITAYFNSGVPYTWEPLSESILSRVNLDPNNADQPSQFNADLRAFYNLFSLDRFNVRLNLLVYNLFDTLIEENVYQKTGRAYNDIVTEEEIEGHRSDFNDTFDRIKNPSMYAAPREVKLGIDISF